MIVLSGSTSDYVLMFLHLVRQQWTLILQLACSFSLVWVGIWFCSKLEKERCKPVPHLSWTLNSNIPLLFHFSGSSASSSPSTVTGALSQAVQCSPFYTVQVDPARTQNRRWSQVSFDNQRKASGNNPSERSKQTCTPTRIAQALTGVSGSWQTSGLPSTWHSCAVDIPYCCWPWAALLPSPPQLAGSAGAAEAGHTCCSAQPRCSASRSPSTQRPPTAVPVRTSPTLGQQYIHMFLFNCIYIYVLIIYLVCMFICVNVMCGTCVNQIS